MSSLTYLVGRSQMELNSAEDHSNLLNLIILNKNL